MAKPYYQTGTLTNFRGASGMLETLLTAVLGTEVTDEIIDSSPDGATTAFSGTAAHSPIGLGRFVVSYTVGSTVFTATDNGSGVIADDSSSGHLTGTNTVTYSSGAWVLNFDAAPDNATDITASYLYGAEGQDWRQLLKQNTKDNVGSDVDGSNLQEVILHSTGASGQENIIIGIREWEASGSNTYMWDLNIYSYWSTTTDWNYSSAQHGLTSYVLDGWSYMPQVPFTPGTYTYWIFSNRTRLVLATEHSSGTYESMYLGQGRRFGAPSDYPNPTIAKGSSTGNNNHSSTGNMRRGIAWSESATNSPYGYHTLALSPSNTYVAGSSQYGNTTLGTILPTDDTDMNFYATLKKTPGGCVFATPIYMVDLENKFTLFDLDGVVWTPCNTVAAEDTLISGNSKYLIIKNVAASTNSDWMGIMQNTTTTTTTSSSTTSTTN